MNKCPRRPSVSLESHLEQQQPFCYQEETAEDALSEVPLLEQLQEGAKPSDHYQERNSTSNHLLKPQKRQKKVQNLKRNHLQKTNSYKTFLSKANPQGKNLQKKNH
jgi:hypothetical protein